MTASSEPVRHALPFICEKRPAAGALPATSELIGLDNIVLTPHLAAVTADTFEPAVRRMFDNIARVARREPLPERDSVA